MWLIARGALSGAVRKVHESYYLPSMTGIATAIYENEAAPLPDAPTRIRRANLRLRLANQARHKFFNDLKIY